MYIDQSKNMKNKKNIAISNGYWCITDS